MRPVLRRSFGKGSAVARGMVVVADQRPASCPSAFAGGCKRAQSAYCCRLYQHVPEQPRARAARRLASRRGRRTGWARAAVRAAASATMDARQPRGRADAGKRKEAGSGNDETQGLRELP